MLAKSTEGCIRCPFVVRVTVLWVGTLVMLGCGPDLGYLPSLAIGQLDFILSATDIDDAVANSDLSERETAKLRLIQDVRAYAVDVMGLSAGNSFTTFYDNRDGRRVFNVSASPMDRLDPVTWTFPIVGTIPYLGYFDKPLADAQADRLRDDGFDVYVYTVDAYSALNIVPNPVQATLLARSDFSLIDTVIHELLHSTVWRRDDVDFNESLATFFGQAGAVRYLRETFPDRPELAIEAEARYQDEDTYNAFMADLYAELETYYARTDLSSEERVAGRERVFQAGRERFVGEVLPGLNAPDRYAWVANIPTSNAWMLLNRRYTLDLALFADVADAAEGDWLRAISVFSTAAGSGDAKGYLKAWIANPTTPVEMSKIAFEPTEHGPVGCITCFCVSRAWVTKPQ